MFMECKLCQIREANQTGSHILSSALIRQCVNAVGENGRDKEMMFGTSQTGEQDIFFGRGLLPEKIEHYNKEPLSDEEIEQNQNELVVDNFFCTHCESLFGIVESKFASDLNNIRTNGLREIEDNLIIRLYFLIQAWRASACRYNEWEMNSEFEEYCRDIILQSCEELHADVDLTLHSELVSIPMILTYLETPEDRKSHNIIVITDEKEPYLLILCDFVLQLYDAPRTSLPKNLLSFLNLNKSNSISDINCEEATFHVVELSNSLRHMFVSDTISSLFAGRAWSVYLQKFVKYSHEIGKLPSLEDVKKFAKLFFDESVPKHKRFSDERIKRLAHQILKK